MTRVRSLSFLLQFWNKDMNNFLKKLILIIILLWTIITITVPWTLSYLRTRTAMTGNEIESIELESSASKYNDEKIIIGAVACGEKAVDEMIVMLKSAILSCIYHGVKSLDAILFADDSHRSMDLKVGRLKMQTRGLNFRYEIHLAVFPAENYDKWKSMFRPCSTERLFIHTALPHIDKLLYLDADTLVVGNIKEVWDEFGKMSSHQVVGIAAEDATVSHGWYKRFSRIPFYPPLGLNAGVILMNLTKLRNDFKWDEEILSAYRTYEKKIVYADQDLINIVFYNHPDALYLLPCSYNYRAGHCRYGKNCESAESGRGGIHILHGNAHNFQKNTPFQIFHKVYSYYEKFNMTRDDYRNDIILPLRQELARTKPSSMNKNKCNRILKMLFKY